MNNRGNDIRQNGGKGNKGIDSGVGWMPLGESHVTASCGECG